MTTHKRINDRCASQCVFESDGPFGQADLDVHKRGHPRVLAFSSASHSTKCETACTPGPPKQVIISCMHTASHATAENGFVVYVSAQDPSICFCFRYASAWSRTICQTCEGHASFTQPRHGRRTFGAAHTAIRYFAAPSASPTHASR